LLSETYIHPIFTNNMAEITEIFKELNKIGTEWNTRVNPPSLSEFMQSAKIVIRITDNEPQYFFPSIYDTRTIEDLRPYFRLQTNEDNVEKIFEFFEKQYEFLMWMWEMKKDLKELNNKKITVDEFLQRNPEIKKGDSSNVLYLN